MNQFFWGPLCLANAIATARNSPSRHALRIVVCVAHLYGVVLYYATSQCEFYLTGRSHSRPEFVYFWVYYVGFNLPWAIVPACELFPPSTLDQPKSSTQLSLLLPPPLHPLSLTPW